MISRHFLYRFLLYVSLGLVLLFSAAVYIQPYFADRRAVFFLAIAGFQTIVSLFFPRVSPVSLGITLLVLPFFGGGALSIVLSGWIFGTLFRGLLVGERKNLPENSAGQLVLFAWAILSLAIFASSLKPLLGFFDLTLLGDIFSSGGVVALYYYCKTQFGNWSEVPRLLAGYLLGTLLILSWISQPHQRRITMLLFLGLGIGAICALVVFLLQYFEVHPFFSLNRGPFWQMTGRYSATFSDPNAFGIMVFFLSLFFIFQPRGEARVVGRILAFVLLFCGLWSGSRTLWLGLLIYFLFFCCFPLLRKASWKKRVSIFFALATVFGAALSMGYPPLNEELRGLQLPPLARRFVHDVSWERLNLVFDNRLMFLRLAYELWHGEKLTGIGLGQFFFRQEEAAKRLGINLGGWRDNANNYYMQILTEGGVVALCLLFLSYLLLSRALGGKEKNEPIQLRDVQRGVFLRFFLSPEESSLAMRRQMLVFCVLLFFGPHINFEEVRYLLALFLALGTAQLEVCDSGMRVCNPRRMAFYIAGIFLLYSAFFLRQRAEFATAGFYGFEDSGAEAEGQASGNLRWSGKTAYFSLCLDQNSARRFQFRALRPGLLEAPLEVRISRWEDLTYRPIQTLRFSDTAWQKSEPITGIAWREGYRIEVSSLWNPAGGSASGDVRWLGVQMKWDEAICEN